MNWQCPRIDGTSPGVDTLISSKISAGLSKDPCHFLSSSTTREQEELARRKAEHMEAMETLSTFGGPLSFSVPSYDESKSHSTRLSEHVLREHFHLPLSDVAKKFGMCTTAFKKHCRKQGVVQWPQRTLKSLEKKIASLHAEQKFATDQHHIEAEIRKLEARRVAILSGNGSTNLDIKGTQSPSEDGSTNSASGGSSPRGDTLLHLTLDDSSSSSASYSSRSDDWEAHHRHAMDDVRSLDRLSVTRSDSPLGTLADIRAAAGVSTAGAAGSWAAAAAAYDYRRRVLGEGSWTSDAMDQDGSLPGRPPLPVAGGGPGAGAECGRLGRAGERGLADAVGGGYRDAILLLQRRDDAFGFSPGSQRRQAVPDSGGAGHESGGVAAAAAAALGSEVDRYHLQMLLAENRSLHVTMLSLSRERDDWHRKAQSVQAMAAAFRLRCLELEHQMALAGLVDPATTQGGLLQPEDGTATASSASAAMPTLQHMAQSELFAMDSARASSSSASAIALQSVGMEGMKAEPIGVTQENVLRGEGGDVMRGEGGDVMRGEGGDGLQYALDLGDPTSLD